LISAKFALGRKNLISYLEPFPEMTDPFEISSKLRI